MNLVKSICLVIFILVAIALPQDYPPLENFTPKHLNCPFSGEDIITEAIPNPPPITGPANLCMILAVAEGFDPIIRYNEYYLVLKELIEDYFNKCSFGQFSVDIHLVAKNIDIPNNRVELFEIQGFDPNAIVATDAQIIQVLQQADQVFDFNLTDGDGDGKVDHFNFCLLRMESANYNGCAMCMNFQFITNDLIPGTTNQYVTIDTRGMSEGIKHMKSGTSGGIWDNLYIILHELSHTLFRFPDMEHGMGDSRWYATGSFDAMFQGVPSLYNPLFRIENGWVVPTRITNTSTLALKNFETDPNHPIYVFWDNDVPGQYGKSKFLITYYDNVEAGIWNRYWPIPHPEGDPQNKKGVMIWRWLDNGFSIKNNFGSFNNRMKAPISIESRHGKWEWNETPFKWERKSRKQDNKGEYIPNITYGLDSLGIKGSYTWLEGNIWKATWEDFRVGSFNCFFTPFVEKNFAFYTNPSSNLPVFNTNDLGRKLVGRHALKNFRVEDGLTKVNFVTGEEVYYVETNEFIKADELFVDHNIKIKNNATLRIAGNSRIYLRNGSQIIIENGRLEAEGTIFDFTQGSL